VSFCGAWTNYGFHEDGCTSGLLCAVSLGAESPFQFSMNGGYPTLRQPLPVPNHLKDKVSKYEVAQPRYTIVSNKVNASYSSIAVVVLCIGIAAGFFAQMYFQ
jgi:hypothetical protein